MSTRPRVVFLDAATLPQRLAFDPALGIDYAARVETTAEETGNLVADADVVITNKVPVRAAHFESAPRLRLICVAAAGTDNVDVAAAQDRGIEVCNVPDYGSESVAEHAIATLFALRRGLFTYNRAAVDGRWSAARQFCWHGPAIRDLGGSLLGIVGRGRIGEATARLARGLGMEVLFASASGRAPAAADERDLDTLLANADAVSLHAPLTPHTLGLINARRLAAMKSDAVLINTGRGALVDAQALADALRAGRIGGAALDVLDIEPPAPSHPLLAGDIPNLLLTPHVAWASATAQARLAERLVALIEARLRA